MIHSKRLVFASMVLVTPLIAHGGQYRGPGDNYPPPGGASGASSSALPSSSAPSAGTGSSSGGGGGPGVAGPTAPSVARSGSAGGRRGISLGEDYSQWQFWWEFNKEPLLDRRAALRSSSEADGVLGRGLSTLKTIRPPSERDIERIAIPALRRALIAPSSGPDIVSSCMVGLARIGDAEDIVEVLRPFLRAANQEKRETAALALGIAGVPDAIPILRAVAGDSKIDVRTRAFAIYGLAASITRNPDGVAEPASLLEQMRSIAEDASSREDLRVAALHVLPALAAMPGKIGTFLRRPAIAAAEALTHDPRAHRLAAHATIALGRVLAIAPGEHEAIRTRLIERLFDPELPREVRRSLCIAVGLAGKGTASSVHAAASEALQRVVTKSRETQAERFALMSLGRLGGLNNERFLRTRLGSSRLQDADRVWTALALGLLGHDLRASEDRQRLVELRADLDTAFAATKQALPASGIALALGMVHAKDSGDAILERLLAARRQDEAAGYFALALGLLRHEESRDELRELVLGSTRRELPLMQGAIALGLLGDPEIVERLGARLAASGSIAAKSSLARALGALGDRRSLPGLAQILADDARPDLPRAFAAVAIGLTCDRESLPWNTRFAVDSNYRANVGTLVGGAAGILDIL